MNRPHSVLYAHVRASSVVVDDLNILSSRTRPAKADAPLVVDADAVLAPSLPLQRFQMITQQSHAFTVRNTVKRSRLKPIDGDSGG
jgi:hypothetical protein